MQVWLVAEAPRVRCTEHGVVVAAVPWARHSSRFVRDLEDQVAWLVTQMSRSDRLLDGDKGREWELQKTAVGRCAQKGDPELHLLHLSDFC